MSHTTRISFEQEGDMHDGRMDAMFVHNGDYSGNIQIKQAGADWSEVTEMPLNTLFEFINTIPPELIKARVNMEDLNELSYSLSLIRNRS